MCLVDAHCAIEKGFRDGDRTETPAAYPRDHLEESESKTDT